ncbi:MAG: BON domain-containing protein [Desulfobulbaceae bacterium]|nr:BON domain-containing protein [Desulfobulbaceae bacterium]
MTNYNKGRIKMQAMYRTSTAALVKMTIQYHRFTSVLITRVETTNGLVTLDGTAGNEAERALVTKCVQDVYGVKNVVNNMTSTSPEAKSNETGELTAGYGAGRFGTRTKEEHYVWYSFAHRIDSAADRGITHMAAQSELGILPERWPGPDPADPAHPAALRPDIRN